MQALSYKLRLMVIVKALGANCHDTLADQKEGDNEKLNSLVIQNFNVASFCENDGVTECLVPQCPCDPVPS